MKSLIVRLTSRLISPASAPTSILFFSRSVLFPKCAAVTGMVLSTSLQNRLPLADVNVPAKIGLGAEG